MFLAKLGAILTFYILLSCFISMAEKVGTEKDKALQLAPLSKSTNSTGAVVVSVKNVKKKYGKKLVLDDVSFDISAGEIFGLLGSNGAGKSTITKIITGLENQSEGKVVYYSGKPVNLKGKIAIVPQAISAYLNSSVEENMRFFASLTNLTKEMQKKRIEYLLSWLQIDGFRKMPVEYLSGGYQRLLNIALSLISDPEIIFFDEPTVGLDPGMRKMFWKKIIELENLNKTIIITTHYMDEAEHLCSKITLLKNGKVVAYGAPKELILEYGGPSILQVNTKNPVDTVTLELLRKKLGPIPVEYVNKTINISMKNNQLFEQIVGVLDEIAQKKFVISSVDLKRATLEDVFINITGSKMGEA